MSARPWMAQTSPEQIETARLWQAAARKGTRSDATRLIRWWANDLESMGAADAATNARDAVASIVRYPPIETKKVVYVIRPQDRQLAKVGLAGSVADRLKALQSHSPDTLGVVAALPGGYEVEAALHRALKAERIRGEWFRLGYPLMRLIELVSLPVKEWAEPAEAAE